MARKIKQKKQREKSHPPIFELTSRISLFFFLLLAVMLMLYVSGNYHKFIDANQKLILYVCAILSVLEFLFSTAGFIESIAYIVYTKGSRRYIASLLIFFFSLIFSAVILVALRVVSFLSSGI